MKILLCNDDGYSAEGIQSLYKILSGKHEVKICAPLTNKSGFSASINIFKELDFRKISEDIYALDGSPVDCVMTALKGEWLQWRDGSYIPDLLLSGINHGGNVGTDITYSGTAAAARQGAIYGIPSMALSLEKRNWDDPAPYCFDDFSSFILNNLEKLLDILPGKEESNKSVKHINFAKPVNYFLNINALSIKKYKGIKLASICNRIYGDKIYIEKRDDGSLYSVCRPESPVQTYGDGQSDYELIHDEYVAISILKAPPAILEDSNIKLDRKGGFIL